MARKILVFLLGLMVVMFAADRMVVLEIATGTWCPHCPAVANGAHRLYHDHPGELLVVEYHQGDPFDNVCSAVRRGFYGVSGYPSSYMDGSYIPVGSAAPALYEETFQERKAIESPLEIALEKTYETSYMGSGTVTATIINVSEETVTGTAHFTVTESHIPYEWLGEDSLHWVERDMLPDGYGTSVDIGPGDTVVLEKPFVINSSWIGYTSPVNFELGCFVQGGAKEVYQAAAIPLMAPLEVEVASTKVDNEDGKLHPGQSVDFLVTLLNAGEEPWDELTGVLFTEDDYTQIQDSVGTWGPAESEEEVTNTDDPFKLRLRTGGSDGHRHELHLVIGDALGQEMDLDFEVFEPATVVEDGIRSFSLSVPSILTHAGMVALSLPRATDVKLVLLDASGRVIKTLYAGQAPRGANLIALPIDGLADGTYFIKATFGTQSRVEKLLILH
jgi:hypothetical protein